MHVSLTCIPVKMFTMVAFTRPAAAQVFPLLVWVVVTRVLERFTDARPEAPQAPFSRREARVFRFRDAAAPGSLRSCLPALARRIKLSQLPRGRQGARGRACT